MAMACQVAESALVEVLKGRSNERKYLTGGRERYCLLDVRNWVRGIILAGDAAQLFGLSPMRV
jgi:hypothetical protein